MLHAYVRQVEYKYVNAEEMLPKCLCDILYVWHMSYVFRHLGLSVFRISKKKIWAPQFRGTSVKYCIASVVASRVGVLHLVVSEQG